MPVTVFFSYAHEDEPLLNNLKSHLQPLRRQGLIDVWYDRDISAGMQWQDEIDSRLNTSDLILLLVSHHFIDSDYCYGREMQRALERHKAGDAYVIPIVLRPVDWEDTPISELQALPEDGKPITRWRDRNLAFLKVVQGIREVVKALLHQQDGATQAIQRQSHQTIDTDEAIAIFNNLLRRDSDLRVLRLIGEAKMGKSHLLTKVFPSIVRKNDRSRYAVLDMRNRMYAVPDILHMACNVLDSGNFDLYYVTYREWNSRLIIKTRRPPANQSMEQDIPENTQDRDLDLTVQFVRDLSKLEDQLLIFLFDSVNQANEYMQTWLANTFLPHVSGTAQIRTVIAGRSLPDMHGSYALYCETYQLQAITDSEKYINFCRELNARLGEQSVRDFAFACDYIPGMFVELVYPKFIKIKDIL